MDVILGLLHSERIMGGKIVNNTYRTIYITEYRTNI